jgi:hypothetical protein
MSVKNYANQSKQLSWKIYAIFIYIMYSAIKINVKQIYPTATWLV